MNKKEKLRKDYNTLTIFRNSGITLVALVVTIVILLILAGVIINIILSENGIFNLASKSSEKYKLQESKDKLQIALFNLQIKRNTQNTFDKYNDVNSYLENEGIKILKDDIVLVNDYMFQIDRDMLKIIEEQKNYINEKIKITISHNVEEPYVIGKMNIEVTYEGTISEIMINEEHITELTKTEGNKYIISDIELKENGNYTVIAKDENDNYQIKQEEVSEITENIEISDKSNLEEFRRKVNEEGRTFEGKTVKLIQDIELNGSATNQWEAIGTETKKFKGTFEGNNKKIEGLYINTTISSQGLFGYNDGTIKNVEIIDGYINSKNNNVGMIAGTNNGNVQNIITRGEIYGEDYTGGIVGENKEGAKILNSKNYVSINKGKETTVNGKYIGGISGSNINGNIEGCINYGNIIASNICGGITGISTSALSETNTVGSLINPTESFERLGKITNCGNEGIITTKNDFVGGICGQNGIITGCYNVGSINR